MEGGRLRSVGHGDVGRQGASAGDLYVVIHVKDHEVFERDENDLYCEVPLPFTLAALGGELEVPTLDGKANIKIPAGTQTNTSFRLKDKGIPHLQSGRKGDLLVNVQVEVPVKLSRDQEKLLKEFSETITDKNQPIGGSFFEKAKRFSAGNLLASVIQSCRRNVDSVDCNPLHPGSLLPVWFGFSSKMILRPLACHRR